MTLLRIIRRGLWPWIRVGRGCLIGRLPGWRCWGRMLVNIESGKNLFALVDEEIFWFCVAVVDFVFCVEICFCGYSC